MPVMTAGMHCAGYLRSVGMTALLYDPQGIHIGTKRNRAVSGSARKTADDAGDNPRAAPSDNGDWKILLSFQLVISPLIIRRGSEAA